MSDRKFRLTTLQRAALEKLSKPDRYLVWSSHPMIVNAAGEYYGPVHANTAISFRWHDFMRKDPTTGWYVITDTGRAAIDGLPSVLIKA